MDKTSFNFYSVMLFYMTFIVIVGPRIVPRLKRLTVLLGCLPTVVLMALGSQVQSDGGRAGGFYAAGLMAMLLCPVASGVIAEERYRRKRRAQRDT